MRKTKFHIILKWGALLGAGLSLIRLLHFLGRDIDYNFGPIFDILMVVTFVAALYFGIKEYREKCMDGIIRFPKSFIVGTGIVMISYVVMVFYMFVHYSVIEKDGIAKNNAKNVEMAMKRMGKDTITQAEIVVYCQQSDSIIRYNMQTIEADGDSTCCEIVNDGIDNVLQSFTTQLTQKKKTPEDALFRLDSFQIESNRILMLALENYLLNGNNANDSCNALLAPILSNSIDDFGSINPYQLRFEKEKNKIPHMESVWIAAPTYSLSIILYGILINIFVALFVYRKEKRTCPEPEATDTETEATDTEPEEKKEN